MASSLRQLLEDEAPDEETHSSSKFNKKKQMTPSRDEISLPLFICSDRRNSVDRHGRRKPRRSSTSCVSSETRMSSGEKAAVDEGVAAKAVVSMLGGYIGRYLRDKSFRRAIRDKCNSSLSRGEPDVGILDNLRAAIDGIEKLAEDQQHASRKKPLRLLTAVSTSLTSGKTIDGIVSACAQLYLSVIHKMEKNDTSSARHLLQVFVDAPFLARTHLLPDLWEHLFLPHLLHIKVWYSSEVEQLHSSSDSEVKRKKRRNELNKVYNCQMDVGTARFARYYKQWLKVGMEAPPIPQIPVPPPSAALRPGPRSRRRASSDSYSSEPSINIHLYQTVFGTNHDSRRSNASVSNDIHDEEQTRSSRRSSNQSLRYLKAELWPEINKSTHSCPTVPVGLQIKEGKEKEEAEEEEEEEEEDGLDDLSKAISTICCSNDLTECEVAVQLIARARLNPNGDIPRTEALISKSSVIEGMLEVLSASNDDEVLELAVSLLSEIISKNEKLGQIALTSDPQLKTFLRLLRRTSIFLKAAVLLYLLKPKAKQMISTEWVPLLLRVLEFGDHAQTLFTIRCVPRVAALYLLEQLLLGFDEDKNLENAREVVSIGGLGLLIKRIQIGDSNERSTAAVMTLRCIRADGSCRNYIAENLKKSSLLELLVLENQSHNRSALYLLIELLCLGQRKQIVEFLKEFGSGYGGLNTMHILLVHLMRSPPEERPLIAAILFQLDLMGDSAKCSVFREEAIEAITDALEDCRQCNEKLQEKSARALMMLGGRFSRTGEAVTDQWLLHKAGFEENQDDRNMNWDEDEEERKIWLGNTAKALLKNKNKNFLIALSGSIADGILVLARASLAMFSWLSSFIHLAEDDEVRSTICTLFIPVMLRLIGYDNALEDRVLASLSLLNLSKNSGGSDLIPLLNEESIHRLRNLSLVTWTANELVLIVASRSRHQQSYS